MNLCKSLSSLDKSFVNLNLMPGRSIAHHLLGLMYYFQFSCYLFLHHPSLCQYIDNQTFSFTSGHSQECESADSFFLANVSSLFPTTENNLQLDGWAAVQRDRTPAGNLQWDWATKYSVTRFAVIDVHLIFGNQERRKKKKVDISSN